MNSPSSRRILCYFVVLMAAGGLGYGIFSRLSMGDPAANVRKRYKQSRHDTVFAKADLFPGLAPAASTPGPNAGFRVTTSPQGGIVSVVPPDIAEVKKEGPGEEKPVIKLPSDPTKNAQPFIPTILDQQAESPLPVPRKLLDQKPPPTGYESDSQSIPTELRIAPRRYLFNNLSTEVTKGNSVQIRPEDRQDFNPETFAPQGEDITLALMGNVASNSFEVPVSAAVWEPLYFQGHRILELGDKVLGNAQAGKNRDRVLVNFNRIIFKDGRSVPLRAIALDPDGTIGIKGFTVGENLLKTLTPVLLESVRGFAEVFQDRTESSASGVFGVTTQTTLGNDLGTKGIESGRGALDKISQIIAQDLEENRPYVLAIAGTICRARLQEPLDTALADYGK